jgi:hypothetical protein
MSSKPDQTKPKKSIMRSPGYPAISLSEAIEKAKIIWDQEKKHPAPLSALETHWGFKVGSGAVGRFVSALGKYGLLEDDGSGTNKTYKLTEAALEILLAPQGSPEKAARIKEAALSPAIFREISEHYNGELPSDANLESYLLLKKKFNPGVVKNFIQTLRETLDFASTFVTLGEIGSAGKLIPAEKIDQSSTTPMSPPLAPPQPLKGQVGAALNALIIPPGELPVPVGNSLVARIPYPISEEDFALLIATLNLWKPKLVKKEDGATGEDDKFPIKA